MSSIVVAALYKFVTLPDYVDLADPLLAFCKSHGVRGTLLLASEGINGTIAGTREGIDAVLNYLKSDPRMAGLEHKESHNEEIPFFRMKVKLKKEIVTMGIPGVDPLHLVGSYVEPQDWNALISDPEVVVLDTRNHYEYAIGTFAGAIDPNTETFREFPDYVKQNLDPSKHKKVAMFCTGGIRCEKSTSYVKSLGFDEVYHLKGGILKYLEDVPAQDSLWQGECFVFDNRVAVNHELARGHYDQCFGCRHPVDDADKASDKYIAGVACPHCYDRLTDDQKIRFAERQKQIALAKQRHEPHIGVDMHELSALKQQKRERQAE
jgi:UPF0176 protein